jgi:hypothetical protein
MAALQTIIAQKANITGSAFASDPLAGAGTDSLVVAAFQQGRARLIDFWGICSDAKYEVQVRSSRMHDNSHGIRFAGTPVAPGAVTTNGANLLMPDYLSQDLYSGDTLTVEVLGTAADDAVFALNILYDQLQPSNVQFIDLPTLKSRMVNLVGIEVAPTASGTPGAYGTARAFNADDDRLKADVSYAILGLTTDVPFVAAQIQGYDFGNFRIGIPGVPKPEVTGQWFIDLSVREGIPLIPVLNANNRGSTTVTVIDAEASTAPKIDFLLAELR